MLELFKYAVWGGLSTAVNLALFYFFVELGLQYILANFISYILAVILSYYLNSYFVFNKVFKGKEYFMASIRYYLMRILAISLDSFLLMFIHEVWGLNIIISKVIVSIFIIGTTYIASRKFIFMKT